MIEDHFLTVRPCRMLWLTLFLFLLFMADGRSAWPARQTPQPYLTFRKTNRVVLDVGVKGQFDSTHAKYPSILKVRNQWCMWYNGRTDDAFTGAVGLATSEEGLNWTKYNNGIPVFEHGAPGTFDSTKVDHPAVLRFDGQYHMWYTAGDDRSAYTIGYARSPDGIQWTRQNDARPVLGPGQKGRFDDQAVLHPAVVRDDSGKLHMWYNGVGPQQSFRVGHATSGDGIHWERQNHGHAVLEPSDVGDFHEDYVYNVFVQLKQGCFHMWYSAWAENDNLGEEAPHNCITHAISHNGDDWIRDDTPTLTNGAAGSLDHYACFACSVVQNGQEQWMYYSAGAARTDGPYRVSVAVAESVDSTAQDSVCRSLFRHEYRKSDLSFCNASVCVDFDNNGTRELVFASRKTGQVQMLRAADGAVMWSRDLAGDQQSLSAFDLDQDGDFEILYTVSAPGRLYVLDHFGNVLKHWDSGDAKLGNSPVILDADGDGRLDGYLGTRSRDLIRLDMNGLTTIARRPGWVQCGCYTSAMDVDMDGQWDLFAGSGDDSPGRKGVLHRYLPDTLQTVWSYATDDNASSGDAVLADIDGDARVEIIKSVDNYAGDDAHDAVYAFETDGTLLWKTSGISGEDSPNVADLDGDGNVEIVGMTFGCEVYCLNAAGHVQWRKNLRPELSEAASHAYLAPILCDLNGDRSLEILAFTNGGYFDEDGTPGRGQVPAAGIVFALSASGEILDRFRVSDNRYWGEAFVCNIDDDPFQEVVVSGSGGLDVIETAGFGPETEVFQRRRTYQRLNVAPWAFEDSCFIHRGTRTRVANWTDNLILAKSDVGFCSDGIFHTELFSVPAGAIFDQLRCEVRTSDETSIAVNVLDASGKRICSMPTDGRLPEVAEPVQLQFVFSTTNPTLTPILDSYSLSFRRQVK